MSRLLTLASAEASPAGSQPLLNAERGGAHGDRFPDRHGASRSLAMTPPPLLSGAATGDIAFTPSVKAIQARKGSREAYARMERSGGWAHTIDAELGEFIAAQTSVFLATANAAGQPYIQHRGGPAGFLRAVDARTIAFADFRGNRQFITSGNLGENNRAFLFLIDYAQRRRIKIWGTARVVEDDAELIATLMPAGYKARAEQAIVFTVEAWDENCSQHIPQRFEAEDVARALAERDAVIAERDARIAALEAELRRRPVDFAGRPASP